MNKLYQIVDEDDNVIGYKLRHDIDWKKDIYRIAALWLKNSQGEVLIAQRVLSKDKDPGKWGPSAAGTIEEGEDYDSNIYKEAEEEIGLSGVKFKKSKKLRFYEPRQAFCQWYIGVSNKKPADFKLQAEEVAQVRWIDPKSLIRDLKNNPDKYVPSMQMAIEVLQD